MSMEICFVNVVDNWCVLLTCCRPKLKEHMKYCADHPEEISKLAKVKAQVSEVKGVMMENIEKVSGLMPAWILIYIFQVIFSCNTWLKADISFPVESEG